MNNPHRSECLCWECCTTSRTPLEQVARNIALTRKSLVLRGSCGAADQLIQDVRKECAERIREHCTCGLPDYCACVEELSVCAIADLIDPEATE